jgi:response regulator NasT
MKPTSKSLRALICEDEGLTIVQLRRALVGAGFEVVGEATDGDLACKLALELKPDFVLMDVNMNGTDGVASASYIMQHCPTAVIMLTGDNSEETVEQAMEAGASCYLVKPIVGEQLIPAVKTAVARFESMQSVVRENETLKDQLEARKMVERAKGILMKLSNLSEDEAFRRMQKTSRDRSQTMKQTAADIIQAESLLS